MGQFARVYLNIPATPDVHSLGNVPLHLLFEPRVQEQLQHTCFRGIGRPWAGNFLRWGSATDFLSNTEVTAAVATECRTHIRRARAEDLTNVTVDISVSYAQPIGWVRCSKVLTPHVNAFQFSVRYIAYRYMVNDPRVGKAPLTNDFTVTVQLVERDDHWLVVFKDLYTGPALKISELLGMVSPTSTGIFYDWWHEGNWEGWGSDPPVLDESPVTRPYPMAPNIVPDEDQAVWLLDGTRVLWQPADFRQIVEQGPQQGTRRYGDPR